MPGPLGIGSGGGGGGGSGTVTSVSGNAPITVANGTTTPAISVTAAVPGAVMGGATASTGTIANGVAAADHVHSTSNLALLNGANTFTAGQTVASGASAAYPTLGGTVPAGTVLALRGDSATYGVYIGVNTSGNTWVSTQRQDGTNTFYNLILNPAGGNVGIGTSTSPAQHLTINAAAGANRLVQFSASDAARAYVGLGTDNVLRVMTTDGAQTRIGVNGGDVAYASTTGLGIFTQPSAALHVNGNGIISGTLTVGGNAVLTTASSVSASKVLSFMTMGA